MGDIKKHKKKYSTPSHPWQRVRIDEEKAIQQEYGTKNKKEIWKMRSLVRNLKAQGRSLIAKRGEQATKEKEQLFGRVRDLGLVKGTIEVDNVLGIQLKDAMERRLQTLLVRKGIAKTMKQARQLITHEHIMVSGRKITIPTYVVKISEEDSISYSSDSAFSDPMHPERVAMAQEKKETKPVPSRDSGDRRDSRSRRNPRDKGDKKWKKRPTTGKETHPHKKDK